VSLPREFIMLHHSLTKDGATVSAAAIEKFHREDPSHRFVDVGYHGLVEQVADPILYGFAAWQAIVGRPERSRAAACPEADMNERALHVCVVGNFDLAAPSRGAIQRLVLRFLLPWVVAYSIPPERIIGHRDAGLMVGKDWRVSDPNGPGGRQFKSCPGALFDLDVVRRLVR
jgi:hypothetical protein